MHLEDSATARGWRGVKGHSPMDCISLGWLVSEDKDWITVSSTWDLDKSDPGVIDPLTIPRSAIRHISKVGES